jgi:hypothetical protein
MRPTLVNRSAQMCRSVRNSDSEIEPMFLGCHFDMSALTRAHLDSHSNDPQAEVRTWIGSLQTTVTTNWSRVSQGSQICRQAASVAWFRISRFWFTAVERKPPVSEGRFFGPASARTSWLNPLGGCEFMRFLNSLHYSRYLDFPAWAAHASREAVPG